MWRTALYVNNQGGAPIFSGKAPKFTNPRVKMGGYHYGLRSQVAAFVRWPRYYLDSGGSFDEVDALFADPYYMVGRQVGTGLPRRGGETAWGSEVNRVGLRPPVLISLLEKLARSTWNTTQF